MTEPLYTDDDVTRGEDALFAAWGLPEKLARRGARIDTQTVLDAVLPAYRKRMLNELADALEGQTVMGPQVFAARPRVVGWDLGVQQVIANIRLRAKETP